MLLRKPKMGKFVFLTHLIDRVVELVFVSSGDALVVSFCRDLVNVKLANGAGFFTGFTIG